MVPNEAVELVKRFEGLRLQSYKCPAGVWTIGYGATGPGIGPGLTWTVEECERRLIHDLEACEAAALRLSPQLVLADRQRAAVISFIFNLGAGAYGRSRFRERLDAGDVPGARAEIARWNKAAGIVLPGLTKRRAAEAELL